MNVDLERKVIEKFIRKDKRKRYLDYISSVKRRTNFIMQLSHFKDFTPELFDEVHGDVALILRERLELIKGSKSQCYVISDNPAIDQQVLPVDIALRETIGYGSAMLVFGDAELMFFEGEPPKNRLLSKILASHSFTR